MTDEETNGRYINDKIEYLEIKNKISEITSILELIKTE